MIDIDWNSFIDYEVNLDLEYNLEKNVSDLTDREVIAYLVKNPHYSPTNARKLLVMVFQSLYLRSIYELLPQESDEIRTDFLEFMHGIQLEMLKSFPFYKQ